MDRITIPEYRLLMEAVSLREVDKDYRNHLQAFLNLSVKAERKVGKNKKKLVFTTFEKFFDYDKMIQRVLHPKATKSRWEGVAKLLRKER